MRPHERALKLFRALPHPTPSDDNESRVMFALLTGFFHLRVPESSAVGSAVGRIKAHDLDIGKNAEVEYTIVPGDGGAMFDITTNDHNQEGIIILKRVRRQARSWARSTFKKKLKIQRKPVSNKVQGHYS